MRRWVTLGLIIITALVLQSTVFSDIRLLGARPELLFMVTIFIAMREGPREGMITGFASGMAYDFMLNHPKGMTALTLVLLGYMIGLLRQYIVSPSPWLPVVLAFVGTFGGLLFYAILASFVGELQVGWAYVLRVALLASVYNALLAPIVYPIIRRVTERSRNQAVFRW